MSQAEAEDTGFRGTDEGGKLKETGTTHWNSPNEGATNESGFTALPGGIRLRSGNFYTVGLLSDWWSATEGGASIALTRRVGYDFSGVNRVGKTKDAGLAVRCLRDE